MSNARNGPVPTPTICEAILKRAMRPGAWEGLSEKDRADLVADAQRQLVGHTPDFLHRAAVGGNGAPAPLLNDALELSFTDGQSNIPYKKFEQQLQELLNRANRQGKVVMGFDSDNEPIILDSENLNRHGMYLGASGVGKSAAMSNLFIQLSRQDGPMILIDPHKTLIGEVLPHLPPHRWKDVVYVDPMNTDRSWGINLLQVGRRDVDDAGADFGKRLKRNIENTVLNITAALSQIQQDATGHAAGVSIQSMMYNAAMACVEREDTTFVDLFHLLADPDTQSLVVDSITDEAARIFFKATYPGLNAEYKERILNKIRPFTQSLMVDMFCRRDESPSLSDLIESNKIIVFDLNTDEIPNTTSKLLGYITLVLLMMFIDKRDISKKPKRLYAFVDEYANFASSVTTRVLAEARKKEVCLIMGFQHLQQLPEEVMSSLGNVSTKCIFRTGPEDAELMCKTMGLIDGRNKPKLSEFTEMPDFRMKLQAVEIDLNDTEGRRRIGVTAVDTLPALPVRADAQRIINRIKAESAKRYGKIPDERDHETVYKVGDVGTRHVLEGVYDAVCAVKNNRTYFLPIDAGFKGGSEAMWALQNGLVTTNLIRAILAAKGINVPAKRLGQFLRHLQSQKLIQRVTGQAEYDQYALKQDGVTALRKFISPGTSRNEGNVEHQQAVLRLWAALAGVSPCATEVPDQKTTDYAPDLMCTVRTSNPATFLQRITEREMVHFQVEYSTSSVITKMMNNIQRAAAAGALPILIIPIEQATQEHLARVYLIHDRLISGSSDKPGKRPSFHVWAVTNNFEIWQIDSASRLAVRVLGTYDQKTTIQLQLGQAMPMSFPPPAPAAPPGQAKPAPAPTPVAAAPPAPLPAQPAAAPVRTVNQDDVLAVLRKVIGQLSSEMLPDDRIPIGVILAKMNQVQNGLNAEALSVIEMAKRHFGARFEDSPDGPRMYFD